jgi:hypothetical protein
MSDFSEADGCDESDVPGPYDGDSDGLCHRSERAGGS